MNYFAVLAFSLYRGRLCVENCRFFPVDRRRIGGVSLCMEWPETK
jgi:hypothetical protein